MEWKWLWVIFVAFLLGGLCECQLGCIEQEKIALLQLKPFFNHIQDVKNYWVEGNLGSDCCKWKRVECNTSTGRVTRLFLNTSHTFTQEDIIEYFYDYTEYRMNSDVFVEYGWQERDQWHLNASLFLPFEELKSLYLGGNSISGCVDNQGFGRLSSKLKRLEILDLNNNYFDDSILASISQLSSLKSLNLADNQFTGIQRLSKLNKLETLDLRGNRLLGNNILPHLHDFTSLKSLHLRACGLNGTVDMLEFNNLTNLKELYLGENEIESLGSLFHSKGQLRLLKLEVLGLTYNLFNNSIFSSLAMFSNLKFLYIEGNRLKGSIPIKDLNALSNLEELHMEDNEVNDFVLSQDNETELKLMNLEVLHLSWNLFNSSILSYLGRLSNLKTLSLGNNLEGSIDLKGAACSLSPQALDIFPSLKTLSLRGFSLNRTRTTLKMQNLTNLEELVLEDSSLPSNFIQDIEALTSLKNLHVFDCEFNGNLKLHAKQNLTSLEKLTLEYSSLPSNFIQDIGTLTSLKTLYVFDCEFNGNLNLHDQWKNSTSNLELVLEDSSFPSNFIQDIGTMTSLKYLQVFGCEFNGSLTVHGPLDLKNLESLEIEGTSVENNFLKKIGAMPSLKFLRLRNCGINGTLCNSQGFCELTNLQYLDVSNNNLNGNLHDCFSSLTSLENLDLSSNQLSGNITALALGNLKSLRYLSLSNNNFEIPSSLRPLFNLSNLKYIDADNNTIYDDETEMHSLAPTFQLQYISLSCCGEVASFPQFLYHQHDLVSVDLSNIHFKGVQFPFWLLENNTKLDTLVLANNSLLGHFKLPFLTHAHLSSLDISRNSLCGNIPNEIGAKLPSLWFLNMSTNNFSGNIPISVGDLNSLETLDLSNNKLTGGVPEHLANGCSSLNALVLSNNILQGHIFSSNFNLLNLDKLQLDGNHFSGRIPDCLSNCSILSTLDVSNNTLSGEIPRWMGNMSNLENIVMANNHLQGPIPTEFCQLNLQLLDLSSNNISGTLPSCLSPLSITEVHLSKNKLQGPLTDSFVNSTMLVTLDLSHNHFTGNIPNWICKLSHLSHLILNNNHFEGWIPLQLCKLGNLSLIDLANNNLSGKIPPCLKIMTLNHIFQDYVLADGPIPAARPSLSSSFSIDEPIEFTRKNRSDSYKGRVLTSLSGIDLSCNKLTGEIPREVGNFQNINVLNLSHNSLTGPIPPTVSELMQIESLDLSNNKLSGKIPSQIVGLTFLSFFSVANNNLSGSTPKMTAQFATFEENSYLGNPFLCGAPLPKSCSTSGPASSSSNPKASYENGLIDMNVFYVSFGVAYAMVLLTIAIVLYINPYWRRAWFYYIEAGITCCYYFLEDNILPKRFRCGCM